MIQLQLQFDWGHFIDDLYLLSASKSHYNFKSYHNLCLLHLNIFYGFESALSSSHLNIHMNESQAELISSWSLATWHGNSWP